MVSYRYFIKWVRAVHTADGWVRRHETVLYENELHSLIVRTGCFHQGLCSIPSCSTGLCLFCYFNLDDQPS